MTPALSLMDVGVQFGSSAILRRITTRIAAGDFFVIIGPNGAGKTTLLKTMAGLIVPTSGSIDLLGRPLADYSRGRLAREIALLTQQVHVDFPFSVAETVLMGRSPHLGLMAMEDRHDREIAVDAMEKTGVGHLAARRLDQLSGGELQRVVIARALCQQPKIMLLDEPTASLDPAHALRIMDLLERLRQQHQLTVVMISHDLNCAAMYGDRLMLMKAGEVMAIGTPHEVLNESRLHDCYGCVLAVDQGIGGVARVTMVPEKFVKSGQCKSPTA